jgi:hypothetical protein
MANDVRNLRAAENQRVKLIFNLAGGGQIRDMGDKV